MPQQRDMFESPKLDLTLPAGASGPRLWVRRLAIWEAPGGEMIRDIALRPGLNIVWSPDGVDISGGAPGERAIGHGSGKTLFCRLLRYCLGERRFADESQREQIAAALPNGMVGAEVMVDGVCWAVVRPLGLRRRHVAVCGGNLDEIAAGDGVTTSIDPLIEAIEQSIVTPVVASLARLAADQKAWPIALAWLTRDQECRFDHVLDWRSAASGSDAPQPASGREIGPRRDALRAFLKAITEAEQDARRIEDELKADAATTARELNYLEWDIGRRQTRLIELLDLTGQSLPEMPLLLELLQSHADARLAAAVKLPDGDKAELANARKSFLDARDELRRLEDELSRIGAQIPAEKLLLTYISSEIPALSFSAQNAASPVCPICEVAIDKVLVEGCRMSHKLHDETSCRERLAAKRKDIDDQTLKVSELEKRSKLLQPDIALGLQKVQQAEKRVEGIESARDMRSTAWVAATRSKEDVERLKALVIERDESEKRLESIEDALLKQRAQLLVFRDKQAITFGQLSEKYSAIVRRLINDSARGKVTLSGTGLDLTIDVDGDRRTAAIESLKVIAFDVACLCLSVEGSTRVPAFIVHDSPREADLGLSIYDELFRMMREFESLTKPSAFQYIITSTTRPPADLCQEPWLILTLGGSPGTERLMRRDL